MSEVNPGQKLKFNNSKSGNVSLLISVQLNFLLLENSCCVAEFGLVSAKENNIFIFLVVLCCNLHALGSFQIDMLDYLCV